MKIAACAVLLGAGCPKPEPPTVFAETFPVTEFASAEPLDIEDGECTEWEPWAPSLGVPPCRGVIGPLNGEEGLDILLDDAGRARELHADLERMTQGRTFDRQVCEETAADRLDDIRHLRSEVRKGQTAIVIAGVGGAGLSASLILGALFLAR